MVLFFRRPSHFETLYLLITRITFLRFYEMQFLNRFTSCLEIKISMKKNTNFCENRKNVLSVLSVTKKGRRRYVANVRGFHVALSGWRTHTEVTGQILHVFWPFTFVLPHLPANLTNDHCLQLSLTWPNVCGFDLFIYIPVCPSPNLTASFDKDDSKITALMLAAVPLSVSFRFPKKSHPFLSSVWKKHTFDADQNSHYSKLWAFGRISFSDSVSPSL